VHAIPHPPQWWGSFCSFTQAPLQQVSPGAHGGEQVGPPVVELALLELDTPPMQHARQLGL
jgi:hypothetical protein